MTKLTPAMVRQRRLKITHQDSLEWEMPEFLCNFIDSSLDPDHDWWYICRQDVQPDPVQRQNDYDYPRLSPGRWRLRGRL